MILVFCPIDKASNTVGIICKQLYAKVILEELDFANLGQGGGVR